jgi:aspartyl-tRNA(Asn)/glutamyl-tRNA(Gln) amidotransferase subunit A
LDSALARVRAVDGDPGHLDGSREDGDRVHAFITLTEERARMHAKSIDDKTAKGESLGPLAGVPFTAKDIFTVKGVLAAAASRILSNFKAPYTATSIDRLEQAGAVMLGKVNLDEFTYGSSNESSAYQPAPRNPWDTSRVPGGSSGGSAAAVAGGEGALSLGTDTSGSIRQPAAFCGVVGLKPTYGRVSRYGLIAFGSSLDCPGPLARNVRDAALMMNVIAGADPRDATAAAVPVPDYTADLKKGVKGLRIGISLDYAQLTFYNHETGESDARLLPKEISDAVSHAADLLSNLGAEIVENVSMPHTRYGIPTYFVISRVEASSNLHRYDGVKYGYRTKEKVSNLRELYRKTRAEGFGPQPKLRVLMGMYMSAAQYAEHYYQRALRVRSLIRSDFDQAFDANSAHHLDALLTPTTPTTAFPMAQLYGDSVLMQYADQLTVTANHAGVPAISIPAGLSSERLPIGIQFIGPDFSESRLFQISRAYELATETESWRVEKPKVVANL